MLKFSLINFIARNYNANNLIRNQFNLILYSENLINQTKYYSIKSETSDESVSDESKDIQSEGEDLKEKKIDPKLLAKDRTKVIPVETSIKYLQSSAYKETYGDFLVWEQYRRNHKGLFAPRKTRKTCIRKGLLSTGNPCPICRDEYLLLHERNIELLNQFLSKQTGEVLSYTKTGLCQKKHQDLIIAVQRAMDCGLLTFDVPFREFDYSEYYPSIPNLKKE